MLLLNQVSAPEIEGCPRAHDAAPDATRGFDMPVAVMFRSLTASRFVSMGKTAFKMLGLGLDGCFLPLDDRKCP